MSSVIETWEKKTGKKIKCACTTCANAGFEVIEMSKTVQEKIFTRSRGESGIPPHYRTVPRANLNLFCLVKHAYLTYPPTLCQLYEDTRGVPEIDVDFLENERV